MSSSAGSVRIIRCPQCQEPTEWRPENPYRPFCSERCKLMDLGAWATGSYRVPVPEQDGGPATDTVVPEA